MTERLGTLMEVSLTMGAVIALLLLLSPLLARRFTPRWRYWAWLFVALRLVIPFNFTLPQGAVRVEAPAALTAPAYDPQMTAELQQARPYGYMVSSVGVWDNTAHFQVWYHDDQGNVFRIFDNPLFRLESVNGAWSLTLHWEGLWAAGCVISLLWLAWNYAALCRRVRRWARPAGAEAREALERQRERLGVSWTVRLLELPGLASPMLMGFLRPAILLPEGLAEDVLPATLAHELTHFQRRDLWYKLLLALARAVHWFNPLVWLMCRRGGEDVELCCDYDLLRAQDEAARRAYGQAILDQMTAGSGSAARLTTGFSGNKKEVFRRFRAIMDTTAKKKGRAALTLALAVVLLAGGLVACDWADSAAPDLTAAGLDFTGYTGTVYTQGNQGAIFTEGSFTITEEPGTTAETEALNTMRLSLTENAALSVDPCDAQGQDSDHTRYLLPLSQDAEFSAGIAISLTGMLSRVDPGPYVLTLENGVVTAVRRAEDQFCAYIMLDGADDPLTLMTDYTMEDGTSFCCSVYAPDGRANYLSGSGTAYPIRYDGTGIYVAGGHFVGRYVFEEAAGELYLAEYANELFDENGAVSYIHYTQADGRQPVDSDSALKDLLGRYERAEPVIFEAYTGGN